MQRKGRRRSQRSSEHPLATTRLYAGSGETDGLIYKLSA